MNTMQHSTHGNPDPPDPIELLMKEHEEGMKYLRQLGNAADYIKANGFSFEAFEQMAEAIRFIDTDIRRHNEKEEQYLFPLLERHVDGPPQVMRSEHRELWKAFNKLRECIKDMENLHIYGTSIPELVQCANTVVDLLGNHIAKENEVLFPMAKNVLTDAEYDRLRTNLSAASTTSSVSRS